MFFVWLTLNWFLTFSASNWRQHSTEIKHDELNQVARLVNQCQSKIKEFSIKFKTFVIHSFTFKSKNCRIQEEGESGVPGIKKSVPGRLRVSQTQVRVGYGYYPTFWTQVSGTLG